MQIRFEEVKLPAQKRVRCSRCGRVVRRQTTFWQTINPWNRGRDGFVKTREDILAELWQEAETWKAEPELCAPCKQAGKEA